MATFSFPLARFLVPGDPEPLPDTFTRVQQTLAAGLPQTVPLGRDLSLVVVVPTGLALAWRDVDPEATVTSSDGELAPRTADPAASTGSVERAPARVVLVAGGEPAAAVPLTAGTRLVVPGDGADGGVRVELAILSWRIAAGAVRSAGDSVSRLEFAWRRADRGTDAFQPPPLDPRVARRLQDQNRMESQLGRVDSAGLLDVVRLQEA